ncbi:MAG TPA: enoyl-CoA hydratase-related protein [Acidimicrobiales bacterium]
MPLVTGSVNDGIGSVRLSDPEHRNALSAELSDDLAVAVASVLADDAGAIVLTADPPVFCAGGSLEGLLTREVPLPDLYRGFEALDHAAVPTIAAVGGPAIGAGVNLPLACDVILVSPGARFDPRFLDVGIHPGGGHLWRLERRIGSQGAAALVLCGDVLDGHDAVRAGLAWRCVDEPDLEDMAYRLARRAAGHPPAGGQGEGHPPGQPVDARRRGSRGAGARGTAVVDGPAPLRRRHPGHAGVDPGPGRFLRGSGRSGHLIAWNGHRGVRRRPSRSREAQRTAKGGI